MKKVNVENNYSVKITFKTASGGIASVTASGHKLDDTLKEAKSLVVIKHKKGKENNKHAGIDFLDSIDQELGI